MRICMAMKVTMVLAIGLLMSTQFMPSLAQLNLPGDCWKGITTCKDGAKTDEDFHNDCCPIVLQAVNEETMCICGVQPILEQDPTTASEVADLLKHCDINTSFDKVCSGPAASAPKSSTPPASAPAPSLPCWEEFDTCISKNIGRSGSMPQFNISSPMFNVTEFLCCSLVEQTAETEKPCFCGVTTLLDQQPSMTPTVMQVVAGCHIAESVVALDSFCEGVSTSLAPGPMTQQGSSEGAIAPSPAINGNTTAQVGTSNKVVMAGSLSSLIIFTSYILF